ncbi:hypothetical protein E1176_00130, partial [Fulvivirga sp. RKSG066]|uniref:DUF5615 family PIN-like protein n=1 Tax=Fulvivirga aurantia TaxID=2529383 RepID=UPI0012BB984C
MKFLANKNFSKSSVTFLREHNFDIIWITELQPGITDKQVIEIAINEGRTIVTHDSDYGELIFKHGMKPKSGIVYFRVNNFSPEYPAQI